MSVRPRKTGDAYVVASGSCLVMTDLKNPKNQQFISGHETPITCMAVSSASRLVASGSSGKRGSVIVRNELLQQKFTLKMQKNGVVSLAFSGDGRFLATLGDEDLVMWDMKT